jgi:hypothetical protein
MKYITIDNPSDQSYPLGRSIFEDRQIVYHGSWSTYSSKIESEGFQRGVLPFDPHWIEIISGASEAIRDDTCLPVSHAQLYPKEHRRWDLHVTPSFWGARSYATDAGGEMVRLAIREARQVESICTSPQKRTVQKARWADGLRVHPNHAPTLAVVKLLDDDEAIRQLCAQVKAAREGLASVIEGGCPVVYAIRVDPSWFGAEWEAYLAKWKRGSSRRELRCTCERIHPDRIVAKATYLNGSPSFEPLDCTTWDDVETYTRQ